MNLLRIGTRGSPLALAQARETRERLVAAHGCTPDDIEIIPITTTGDRIRDRPLAESGGKGLFTREIEEALLAGAIDVAVHSMKDMPARLPGGLTIGALLPREDPRDAFISAVAKSIADLPHGAIIGSSSVRRTAQMLRLRPDTKAILIRGNVETRLRKLAEGKAHATFLACAGLNRLGLSDRITAPISTDVMLPAVAQGAIGVEIKLGDRRTAELVAAINDPETAIAVACERAFLSALDGSCRTPLAGLAIIADGRVSFRGHALTLDGAYCFEAIRDGPSNDAALLGAAAGEEVRSLGGALISF